MITSKIRKGVILSAILALLIVFTQIPFASSVAAYKDDAGNYLLYEGDAGELNTIKYVGGTKDVDFTVGIGSAITRYGNAISLKAKRQASGWAEFSTSGAPSIANAVGIAMYVKLPNATNTNINFRMINSVYDGGNHSWGNYNAMPGDCKVTYVDGLTGAQTVKYEIPGASMPGFEGFIFVEFAELDANPNADNWTTSNYNSNITYIGVSPYWDNNTSADSTFYFDNIGFYNTIDGYIALANSKALSTDVVFDGSSVNAFVNGCGNYYDNPGTGSQTNTGTAVQLADFDLKTVANPMGYGNAVSFKIPREGTDGYLKLPVTTKAALSNGKVRGLALYCEIPDIDNPFSVELENVNVATASLGNATGCKVTYIANDGTVTVKENSYPGSGMAGFKGFMFIDGACYSGGLWSNFITGVTSTSNIHVRFSAWRTSSAWAGKEYVIDCLGFYSDIQTYLDVVAAEELTDKSMNKIAFRGNSIDGVKLSEPGNLGQSWNQEDTNSTAYGSSVAFYNSATGANCNGGIMFPLYGAADAPAQGKYEFNKFDLSKAKGIAFYLSIPERQSTAMYMDILYKNWGSNTVGGYAGDPNCRIAETPNITYYPINGDKFTRNNTVLADLNGFEGFVFVPYTEFSQWGYPLSDASKLAYYDINQLAIRFTPWIADGSSDLNKKFYLNNLGFYSDEAAYMNLAKANIDSSIVIEGQDNDDVTIPVKDGMALGNEYGNVYVIDWSLNSNPVTSFTAGNYAADYKANCFNKAPLTTYLQGKAGTAGTDVRFVSSIDANYEGRYNKVGFIMSTVEDPLNAATPKVVSTHKIWDKIYVANELKSISDVYTNPYSKYFFAYDITNINESKTVYVRSFIELMDGSNTRVYGELKTVAVSAIPVQ